MGSAGLSGRRDRGWPTSRGTWLDCAPSATDDGGLRDAPLPRRGNSDRCAPSDPMEAGSPIRGRPVIGSYRALRPRCGRGNGGVAGRLRWQGAGSSHQLVGFSVQPRHVGNRARDSFSCGGIDARVSLVGASRADGHLCSVFRRSQLPPDCLRHVVRWARLAVNDSLRERRCINLNGDPCAEFLRRNHPPAPSKSSRIHHGTRIVRLRARGQGKCRGCTAPGFAEGSDSRSSCASPRRPRSIYRITFHSGLGTCWTTR